ncbi:hypothetical protein CBS101457_002957 [Exobasidium rhododendri]|nr:hypothetical protein CBS101457_002957 [Exobasidium rhododendri]
MDNGYIYIRKQHDTRGGMFGHPVPVPSHIIKGVNGVNGAPRANGSSGEVKKSNGTNGVNGSNGHHTREDSKDPSEGVYDVAIVGGGQAGLGTAGWCKSYGLKYVVLERNSKIGENWTKRYDSAKLHTSHRFNDLPFGPTFTKDDPDWLTTKALSDGYRKYVDAFGINVWTSSTLVQPAAYEQDTKTWTLQVEREGSPVTLRASHIVLANGLHGAVPFTPSYPNVEHYRGTSIHSANYKNCKSFAGKSGIVVGTANTGHDVAQDMYNAQLSQVTMVQRGATYVVPREHFVSLFDLTWNDQIPSELSDRFFWSTPTAISRLMTSAYLHPLSAEVPERWKALENVGFNVDIQGDFVDHLLVRFGGHYMDCGTSRIIADGHIKVKGQSAISGYTATGLKFADGTTLDADLIVWCTGFEEGISEAVRPILGEKVMKQLKPYWGVDEEGEVKGAFVPSGVEHCWLAGGGCSHARYFTRFIALQIQAEKLGIPMDPYYT